MSIKCAVVGLGMGNVFGGMMAGTASAGGPATGGPGTPPPMPGVGGAAVMPFFVALNGQQAGPFEMALLANMAAKGELKKETLVWCQGMANWTKAGDVPALAGVFGVLRLVIIFRASN